MYYDLSKKEMVNGCEKSIGLAFLYNSLLGRLLLKLMTNKIITKIYASYMNSKLSILKVNKFIKKNKINMDDYEEEKYLSFNDFFMRKIKEGKRVIDDGLISVCDSKLSVYEIDDKSSFNIKNSIYTLEELLGESVKNYKYALVFRLCVDDYHHYVFPDDGNVLRTKFINGKFHTVRPIAQKKYKVFKENSRCITFLDCKNLGKVCYIEVGAMMVGKIVNENIKFFRKGEEKGHFEFGGSTVIMLLEDKVKISKTILDNTKNDIETIVKLGNKVGTIK